MSDKPDGIKIISMTSVAVDQKSKIISVMIYGLGEDGVVYVWLPLQGGWKVCSESYLRAQGN